MSIFHLLLELVVVLSTFFSLLLLILSFNVEANPSICLKSLLPGRVFIRDVATWSHGDTLGLTSGIAMVERISSQSFMEVVLVVTALELLSEIS